MMKKRGAPKIGAKRKTKNTPAPKTPMKKDTRGNKSYT